MNSDPGDLVLLNNESLLYFMEELKHTHIVYFRYHLTRWRTISGNNIMILFTL